MKKTLLFLTAFTFLFIVNTKANNVSITSVSVPTSTTIQFDISWDNSWYISGTNWDAVWVFIKAQDCAGTTTWDHVNLSVTASDHTVAGGTGLYVEPTATDGKGVFIRRNSNGFGTQTGTITLKFASAMAAFATTNFHVYGIEMVWVPTASFVMGDNSTAYAQSAVSFGSGGSTNGNYTPYSVSSENAIAQYTMRNDNATTAPTNLSAHNAIPAAFPKGYSAFYCMKYEISQQGYVAFLNDLSLVQQGTRTAVPPSSAVGTLALTTSGANQNRNSIVIRTAAAAGAPAVYGNDLNIDGTYGDGGDIACNYLSWDDLKAYLDWTALRPMTEMEYEKAAIGSGGTTNMQYAWGNATITQADASALGGVAGGATEVSSATGNGLCAYNRATGVGMGPLRCGFAATSSTIRTTAGASYWGALDLSGNVWEQCFSVGYYNGGNYPTAGILYLGSVGDGAIDGIGNCTDATWGNAAVTGVTIVRGGNWEYTASRAQAADRFYVNSTAENSSRTRRVGGRGVRRL